MFGYVFPCKMELKIKDFEKFKAYYCGLCINIKNNYGNIPRVSLNYDMTFLAILLDSLDETEIKYKNHRCFLHPTKKKTIVIESNSLDYAAFCNVCLTYYKLMDDVKDDKSLKSKLFSTILNLYLPKIPDNFKKISPKIKDKLEHLYFLEENYSGESLDELADPFAELTGILLSSNSINSSESLYWLGYNLGKWIYIIDALDDLEEDISKNKFNAINKVFNQDNITFNQLKDAITPRIDFILTNCAMQCSLNLNKLTLKKNEELLYNILNLGLLEKMDKVKNRSEIK